MNLCDISSYIRFVYSQCHADVLNFTEQNVNNQSLTQASQLYVHIAFRLKVIRSLLNLPTCGHEGLWAHKPSLTHLSLVCSLRPSEVL